MPKLWDETVDTHRRAVRAATVEATAELVHEHGLRAVTMSQIAKRAGIGRATLYKYFSDMNAILVAWHEQQVTLHLEQLTSIKDGPGDADSRLRDVVARFAEITRSSRSPHAFDLPDLHEHAHAVAAQQRLRELLVELIAEAVQSGSVRDDVAPAELAEYCRHALAAAPDLPTDDAVHRLVAVVLAGLSAPGVRS